MNSISVRLTLMLGIMILIFTPRTIAQTSIPDFAPNPPLGFNSFDSYRTHLSEDKDKTHIPYISMITRLSLF